MYIPKGKENTENGGHRTQGLLDCGVQSENIRETQEKTELQRLLRHDGQDKVRGVRVQFPQSHAAVFYIGKRQSLLLAVR